ncbi:hypothetical protein [Paenibacillus paridis]|uniref:hypothetical protein n=1 Tax=Paenibacillus paridis TaxID=2583376 RepID=UPI001122526F|nr:hypothetical protein [Paenibacillus paridis]
MAMPQTSLTTFNLHRDIVDSISSERFHAFIKEKNLVRQSGYSKQERVAIIEDAINVKQIALDDFEGFLSNELMRNRNKTIFYSKISFDISRRLKSLQYVQSCLLEANMEENNFNNILKSIQPDKKTCCYLDIQLNSSTEVSKIKLCFAESVVVGKATPNTLPRKETDFTWLELDLQRNLITIRVFDRNANFGGSTDKAKYQFCISQLKSIFNIRDLQDVSYQRSTLYKMFNELLSTAEEPFKRKVASVTTDTSKLVGAIIEGLCLTNTLVIDDLNKRHNNLLIRSLIQENFQQYSSYSEGKKGLVDRYYYTDNTGASVNAKTNDDQRSISLYDIYLDTKHSIDNLKKVEKLWITWYRKITNRFGEKIIKVRTKIEVFKECYVIHFLYEHLTEEAEIHVLSEFEFFERLSD